MGAMWLLEDISTPGKPKGKKPVVVSREIEKPKIAKRSTS
jgi:hypothetical protein